MKKFDYNFCDPYEAYTAYHRNVLKNFLMNIFKWNGLPDSIDERFFNDSLIMRGYCTGFKYTDGKIYVTDGALSGIDEYYRPIKFTAANIKFNGVTRKIDEDCAVCYNTYDYSCPYSLNPMIEIYARRLADLDVSVDTSIRNSRVCIIPVVEDDKDAIRTTKILEDMYKGKPATLSFKTKSFNGKSAFETFPIKSKDNIVVMELADARRNIMADFYAELGIDTLAVDKKAQTNLIEMTSNTEQLGVAREVFLVPRQRWADKMNEIFGTNISVDFNPEIFKEEEMRYDQSWNETGVDKESETQSVVRD